MNIVYVVIGFLVPFFVLIGTIVMVINRQKLKPNNSISGAEEKKKEKKPEKEKREATSPVLLTILIIVLIMLFGLASYDHFYLPRTPSFIGNLYR